MPTPDFLNPCEGKTGDALKECYEKTLQLYGVGTMDADDLKVTEVKGKVGDLEQFSYEQLAIILQGVQTTGTTLAKFLKTLGKNVTAAEAFRLIYGSVEFGYDVDQTSGLTITTSDSTNHNDIIYILLNDSSFGLSSTDSQVGFETLPDSFVVVHELGHAFANRHSQKNDYGLPASEYVKATNATWYPGGGYTTEASIRGLSLKKASDATGKQITNAQGQPLYIVPSGLFMPGNYEGMDRRYFFNELRPGGSNPGEGFADTFASFFLNPDVLPIGANRRNYFEENMPQWVKDIVCPERNCDEIS
jgi:hypothetical protein